MMCRCDRLARSTLVKNIQMTAKPITLIKRNRALREHLNITGFDDTRMGFALGVGTKHITNRVDIGEMARAVIHLGFADSQTRTFR
jgi:hypothetical protein